MSGFEKLVIFFSIYSFIGWVCEITYCSLLSNKFVNRGFLAGPVCPVYGFGAIFVIWILKPAENNILVVFLSGIVITSTVEYVTGWLLEVFFSTRWWDYRNKKFNINGRVCLMNSIMFGFLCVLLIKVINPFAEDLVSMIPVLWGRLISIVIISFFIADSIVTLNTLVNLNTRLKKLHDFTEELKRNADIQEWFNEHEFLKSFEKLKLIAEEGKNELNQKLKDKFESLTSRKGSGIRIIRAFPDMKSIKYDVQLNHLKEALKELKQKARKRN